MDGGRTVGLVVAAGIYGPPSVGRENFPDPRQVQGSAIAGAPQRYMLVSEENVVLFPGAGILVISAWCLGVLNSHGRFLLAYTAPVAWNAAMIATLLLFGYGRDLDTLALYLAWGSVVGSGLQFGVQAPFAWKLSR